MAVVVHHAGPGRDEVVLLEEEIERLAVNGDAVAAGSGLLHEMRRINVDGLQALEVAGGCGLAEGGDEEEQSQVFVAARYGGLLRLEERIEMSS